MIATWLRRAGPWLLLLGLAAFLLSRALKVSDFTIFLEAAEKLRTGRDPYYPRFPESLGYAYSPFFALLLVPFSYLPFAVPQFLWLGASVFFLYRSWMLCMSYFRDASIPARMYRIGLGICIAVMLRFIILNFNMVQMTPFLLWACLEGVRLADKGKDKLSGILLGVAAIIKVMPLPMSVYLLYRGKWRAAAWMGAIIILCLLLPALFLGWEKNVELHQIWWSVINPSQKGHLFETGNGTHSLTALLPVLLTETEGVFPYKRNIANLTLPQIEIALTLARLLLLGLTLFFLRTMPFRNAPSPLHKLRELSYILLCIPLIFPHQQKYAFLFCGPAVMYITFFFLTGGVKQLPSWQRGTAWVLAATVFLCMAATDRGLIGKPLNDVMEFYRVMTYGALALIPLLGMARFR